MVATGFSYVAEERAHRRSRCSAPAGVRDVRRAGAAALDLAYVACGRVDAFYQRGLKRWDEAAGAPARRRGGRDPRRPRGRAARSDRGGDAAAVRELAAFVA